MDNRQNKLLRYLKYGDYPSFFSLEYTKWMIYEIFNTFLSYIRPIVKKNVTILRLFLKWTCVLLIEVYKPLIEFSKFLSEINSKASMIFEIHTQLTFTCSKSTIETLKKDKICSKLTKKTPEQCQWRRTH